MSSTYGFSFPYACFVFMFPCSVFLFFYSLFHLRLLLLLVFIRFCHIVATRYHSVTRDGHWNGTATFVRHFRHGFLSLRRVFYWICGIWSRRPDSFFFSLFLLFLFLWPFLFCAFISLAFNVFTCPMGYHTVLFRFSLSFFSFFSGRTVCPSSIHRCNRPGLKGQRGPFCS